MALSRDYFRRFGLPPRGRRPAFTQFGAPVVSEVPTSELDKELSTLAKEAGLTIEQYKEFLAQGRGMSLEEFKLHLETMARKAANAAATAAANALNATSGTTSPATPTVSTTTSGTTQRATSPWLYVAGAFIAWKLLK